MQRAALVVVGLCFVQSSLPARAGEETTAEFYQGLEPKSMSEFQAYSQSIKLAVDSIGNACFASQSGSVSEATTQFRLAVDEYRASLVEDSVIDEETAAELDGYFAVELLHQLAVHAPLDPILEDDLETEILPNESITECLGRTCEDCGGTQICPWAPSGQCPPTQFGVCVSEWPLWGCIFRRHACCVLGGDRC